MLFGLHVFTAFDTWWPNIEAAVLWAGPPTVYAFVQHKRAARRHRRMHEQIHELHAHLVPPRSGDADG